MQLNINFKTIENFRNAVQHFELESNYYGEKCTEFKSLGFSVSDESEADILEKILEEELCSAGFDNFNFELE